MEFEWYFKLPNFQNEDEWIEFRVLDFYFDPKQKSVREDCKYGCAPENLVIGMIIMKKHVIDPNLVLLEYRGLDRQGPLVLKWLDITDKIKYGAALKVGEEWRVRAKNQVFMWEVGYDEKKRQVISATPFLKSVNLPPLN